MVSKQTKAVSQAKVAQRERLVKEMEKELGLAKDHPEDEEVLAVG